jgi:hypothetical protein
MSPSSHEQYEPSNRLQSQVVSSDRICGTLCDIGRATDRDWALIDPTHPIPDRVPVPALFDSKRTGANLGSLVLVGLETLKYYSKRQNAHSQTGNASCGSETVVG